MASTATQPVPGSARTSTSTDHTTRKAPKAKKAADPVHTSKQIEDTIAQLEKSRAGDKEQEMEIGECESAVCLGVYRPDSRRSTYVPLFARVYS